MLRIPRKTPISYCASCDLRAHVNPPPIARFMGERKVVQCNIRNITRRKEAEAKVRSLNVELEQRVQDRTAQTDVLNREWEAFNYSVSHDLRAPLRWIGGFAKALDEDYGGNLDAAGQQFIQKIRASAEPHERPP